MYITFRKTKIENISNKLKKIACACFIVITFMTFSFASKQNANETGYSVDVLIIYSTGTPYKWKDLINLKKNLDKKFKDIDAITTPTPLLRNCETIALKMASALSDKNLVVRVAEANDIKDRSEILKAYLVVVGSPAYFGNVSWKIKKLFDEQFHKIYLFEKERLNQRRIAAFSMAEVKSSARGALKAIESVVNNCNGLFGPTTIFLIEHSEQEINARLNKFVDQLSILAKEK